MLFISSIKSLILSGGRESFARYPKWAQTFENEIRFEFKTHQSNAILLYTDDGTINHNFLIISILESYILVEFRIGEIELIPPKRQNIYLVETKVDDGKWHYFTFFQAWENIKIQLDEEIVFRLLDKQKSFMLGNIRTNSDIFVGGIPKDVEKLSVPLRRYSKRFSGSIRNLMYRIYPQGMAAPLMIDSYGTRKTDDDYCLGEHSKEYRSKNEDNFCLNSGLCYSANNGPRCDCFFSDYEGRRCENKKPSTEVSFFGNEWIGYDILQNEGNNEINEDPDLLAVLSHQEIFNISFRTNFSKNSLLFVAGDSKTNFKLTIENGELLATHQLAETDKRLIRVQDRNQRLPLHFDDNLWHSVCVVRELNSPGFKGAVFSIRLIVDDLFDQKVKQFTPQLKWLGNSFFFVGGVPQTLANLMQQEYLFPYRGCLKKIFFQSGPVEINLIQLADQGFGQSNVQTFGDLTFSCMPTAHNAPLIFSFNNGNNYTKLPAWRSPSRGTLAFQFRTLTPDGLLLYHGMAQCRNFTICDYLAFELINGHLFMVINLGSGDIRLQASSKSLHDGLWHSVVMERGGRKGFISVDSLRTEFSCPGISANLDIDETIFLGAVPWPDPFSSKQINENHPQVEAVTIIEMGEPPEIKMNFPSSVWSINLRQGFYGCLKNIRLNGINIEIAHMFQSTKLLPTKSKSERNHPSKINESISIGCPFSFSVDYCKKPGSKNPCKNGGICSSYHNSFHCDCSDTPFDGINCQQKPRPLPFPLPESISAKFHFSDSWQLEAENLEIKFRPKLGINLNEINKQKKLFVLIDTKSDIINDKDEEKQRLLVAITGSGGLIVHWVFQGNEQSTFNLSYGNITNNVHWHSLKIIRRGQRMGLKLDGKWHNQSLNNIRNKCLILSINEIAIAQPIGTNKISNNLEHLFRFHGDLRILSLNGHDLLRPIRVMKRQKGSSSSSQIQELNLDSSEPKDLKNIEMENKQRNLSADNFWKDREELRQTNRSQQLNLQLSTKFQNDSISSVSSSFFFTKSPLGCLRQNARNCIPEPAAEDSFFTPIISKSLSWGGQTSTTSYTFPTSITTTTPKPSFYSTKTSIPSTSTSPTKTTTTRKRPHSWSRPKNSASIPSASPIHSQPSKLLSSELNSMDNSETYNEDPSTSEKQQILNREEKLLKTLGYHNRRRIKQKLKENEENFEKGREIEESSKMEEEKEEELLNKQIYIPKGGWPMRTRTWPDGRRLGSDGLKKWQKLRPQIQEKEKIKEKDKIKETKQTTIKTTISTTKSSTKNVKIIPSLPSTASTKITQKTTEMPLQSFTVDPGNKPGLHFTFAPTPKPSTSTTSRKTLAPRFPVGPNDPTLYAVRPTTPMNGASQYGHTPSTVC